MKLLSLFDDELELAFEDKIKGGTGVALLIEEIAPGQLYDSHYLQ
jgi:hypothetical protein